ncbi:hypothetical protein [Catenulispora yoronensis]
MAYVTGHGPAVAVVNTATGAVAGNIEVAENYGIGDSPIAEAAAPDGSQVYVLNRDSGTVSVVRATTGAVTATIPVGFGPLGFDVARDGKSAYVLTPTQVVVVDLVSDAVTADIAIGQDTHSERLAPNGSKLYVTNTAAQTVSVIDTASATISGRMDPAFGPDRVTLSPDGTRAYVGGKTSGDIVVFDTSTFKAVAHIALGAPAGQILFVDGGRRAYVLERASGKASVIDTATETQTATIDLGDKPDNESATTGNEIYISCDRTIDVVNTSTNTVAATIWLATFGGTVRFNAAGTLAYVNDLHSGKVDVIDTSTRRVKTSILVGSHPLPVVFGNGGAYVFTASRDHSTLSIIEADVDLVVNTVSSILNEPGAIAEAPNGKLMLVASSVGNVMRRVNPATMKVFGPVISLPDTARAITFSPDSRYAYVATAGGMLVMMDTATGTGGRIMIGGSLSGIAEAPDSSKLYLVDSGYLVVLDPAKSTVKTKIPLLDGGAGSVAVSPNGAEVVVTDDSGSVSVIDAATESLVATVFTSEGAHAVVFAPDSRTAYVAAGSVLAVDTASHNIAMRIADSADAAGLAMTPDGTKLFVDNAGADSVSVLDPATGTVTATIPVGSPGDHMGPVGIVIGR